MSQLFNSAQNVSFTANGAVTLASSLDAAVDLFFLAGASRGKDISGVFRKALAEDKEVAVRILLWLRDVRGGAGERKQFRNLVKQLDQETQVKILDKIPELGRWDDLLEFAGTPLEAAAFSRIQDALADGNGLCAKWMPRKKYPADKLRKFLDMTPKQYRKTLVELSNTVEQLMCAGQWSDIDYGKIPSVAAARYQRTFSKHDEAGYAAYRDALVKGEAKINASAIFPHDIVKSVRGYRPAGDPVVADAQWKALPNYLEGCDERVLPMVDVSGSMGCPVGGNPNVQCMDVAIALGIYLAERNTGIFRDQFMTFSSNPAFVTLQGATLRDRVNNMSRADWDMTTDLQKAFAQLLLAAKRANLPESEMPTQLLILSDMEFNSACDTRTNYEVIRKQYEAAGYKLPQIVFWNLNGRVGNVPAGSLQKDVALVSGFSPSIMKGVLGAEDFTPRGVMLSTVMVERYDF